MAAAWLLNLDFAGSIETPTPSPFRLVAAQAFVAGTVEGQVFVAGPMVAQAFVGGIVEGQTSAQ